MTDLNWQQAFDMKTPCDNCPFLKEGGIRVSKSRTRSILNDSTSFPCHKTVNYDAGEDEDGESVIDNTAHTKVCAGYMIMLFKADKPNQILQIASRIGPLNLDRLMKNNPAVDRVFDSFDDMIEASEDDR